MTKHTPDLVRKLKRAEDNLEAAIQVRDAMARALVPIAGRTTLTDLFSRTNMASELAQQQLDNVCDYVDEVAADVDSLRDELGAFHV